MCREVIKCSRQLVLSQARKYIGCPYRHQGRDIRSGIDCLGLVVGVAKDLKLKNKEGRLIETLDYTNYARLGGAGSRLLLTLEQNLKKVDTPKIGSIVVFKIIKSPQHVCVVGERNGELTMIHAYQPSSNVCETYLTKKWEQRIISVYDFYEVSDG